VIHRVKEERNILHTAKTRKAKWIDHLLRRICLLKYGMEGKTEEKCRSDGKTRKKMQAATG